MRNSALLALLLLAAVCVPQSAKRSSENLQNQRTFSSPPSEIEPVLRKLRPTLSGRLPALDGFVALTEAGPARQAPYCAKGQWVNVPLDGASDADLTDWLANAHGLIAAKLTRKARAELGLA